MGRRSIRQRYVTAERTVSAHVGVFVLLFSLLIGAQSFGQTTKYATWDKFFYNVQLPIQAIASGSELVLFINHSYPDPLHKVQITGESDVVKVTRQPAVLPVLEPTDIVSVSLALLRTDKAVGETAALQLSFRAQELPGVKTVTVTVPLTVQAEQTLHQQMAVPVGAMEVRVGGFGNQVYLLYLLPMLAVLAWWLWRRRRVAHV